MKLSRRGRVENVWVNVANRIGIPAPCHQCNIGVVLDSPEESPQEAQDAVLAEANTNDVVNIYKRKLHTTK